MKKLFIFLLAYLSAFISIAKNGNTTLYIYRNDGMFNAFFYSEVDSMLCSMIDTMGIDQNEYVVQEIYTTDSLYRIPLCAIDSISFITPKVEYQKNVKVINTLWSDYVISVDEQSIEISKTIPSELMPNVGQVIISETYEHPFEKGFAGRVSEINSEGANHLILCSDVTIKEIYKTLVCKGRSKSTDNTAKTKSKRAEERNEMGTVYFDIPHNLSLSLGPLSLNASPTVALDYIICINDEQTYIDNRLTQYYDCSAQLDCEITGGDELVDLPLSFPIRTTIPGLYAEINVGIFFDYSGGITISMNKPFTITGTTGYIAYDDHVADIDEWHFESKDTEFSANINGSIRFGMAAQAKLGFITDRLASIDVTGYFGPEITANLGLSSDGLLDGSLYTALKDSKITLNAYGAIKPGWRFTGFEHQELNYNPSFHFELNQWYILPEFNNLSWTQDQVAKGGKLDGGINRDLFWPGVQLGWSLYDRNGKMYASHYYPETYRLKSEWPWNGLEIELNDLPSGSKYIAYPMIRILGYEMRALPSTEVKINPLIRTGNASDICETSAVISGYVEGLDYSMVADVGICYSTDYPITGKHVSFGSRAVGVYSVPLYELTSNTTYYYAAYAYYDGEYYYGDIYSFKTKEQEISGSDPNPNPDPDPTPIVTTGGHYNETTTTAMIECTYENIPHSADCGYYLYGQKGGTVISNTSWNFGYVEGTQKAHLTDLIPASTYYYQAYAYYKGEEYLGEEKSFQTAIPKAVTGSCSDVTSNKAIIICEYYDVPPDAITGVKLSYDGQTIECPYSHGEGKHTIDVDNLLPETTYKYSAFIKYKEYLYEGSCYQFTTLTPDAFVGQANNIEVTSAQFDYGFSNIPEDAACQIALQQTNGETYYYPVSAVENDIFELSGLQPNTSYTYWAFVEYYDKTWISGKRSFTTKKTSCSTGNVISKTLTSAVVKGVFNDVAEGMVCGIMVSGDNGSTPFTTDCTEGEHEINLTGLEPATTYKYWAYIDYNGTRIDGDVKSFTTESPSLAGTWSCTINKTNGTEVWKITLTEDGKGTAKCIDIANSVEYNAQWRVGAKGQAYIGLKYIMNQPPVYYYTSYDLSGTLNSMFNPSSVTGNCEYRTGNGISENGPGHFTFSMSK